MKGRIIGREGRNIRAFEQVTGVNVMIDDTPESVLLSCFDPVRRETARITLTELVKDGRIHPARIEEVHERSQSQIEALCLRAAEDAMAEVGISDLHPALVPVLGTLRYRTSYGQNVLKHLVESAHIAGLMAAELQLDIAQCKRAAFLHDIGKALTHEVEGSHAIVGADLARKYGENADVVHAIEAHHNEVEVRTVEAVLVQAADAISGSRPGARRESIEAYVQRLERLEEIARARDGRRQGLRHAGRPGDPGDGGPGDGRRHRGPGAGPRPRQADRGGADLPRPDQGRRGPRVPGHRDRPLDAALARPLRAGRRDRARRPGRVQHRVGQRAPWALAGRPAAAAPGSGPAA